MRVHCVGARLRHRQQERTREPFGFDQSFCFAVLSVEDKLIADKISVNIERKRPKVLLLNFFNLMASGL